ncbi:hypothetical protein [Parasitella parasitica]|uniref:Uncharacterized protein n=1 Tax=Parasitella parasitica TaxID=35722 RepID=A0A0B7NQC3_9FUNG|nr:hypothetical protein [Parasitella parasitica]
MSNRITTTPSNIIAEASSLPNTSSETEASSPLAVPSPQDLHSSPALPQWVSDIYTKLNQQAATLTAQAAQIADLHHLVQRNVELQTALQRIAELEQVTATSNASLSHSAYLPAIDQPAPTVSAPSYAATAASAESATAPTTVPSTTHDYPFLYLSCRGKDSVHKLRCNLTDIRLENSRILDAFGRLQVQPVTDFDPRSPSTLKDPKYRNSSDETFLQEEAVRIHQARLLNIVKRIHNVNRQIAVACHFCFVEHLISEVKYSSTLLHSQLKPHKTRSTAAANPDDSTAEAEDQFTAPSNNLDSSSLSTSSPADGISAPATE